MIGAFKLSRLFPDSRFQSTGPLLVFLRAFFSCSVMRLNEAAKLPSSSLARHRQGVVQLTFGDMPSALGEPVHGIVHRRPDEAR